MKRHLFINLAVKDLNKTKAFFTALGFSFNPQFTDDKAACMIIGPESFAMLLTEEYFQSFTNKSLPDNSRTTGAMIAISGETREEVDWFYNQALANGGSQLNPTSDLGFMYSRSFADPNGYYWEVFWMDPAHLEPR